MCFTKHRIFWRPSTQKILNYSFKDALAADTFLITLDNWIYSLDTHGCNGSFLKDDTEEFICDIILPKSREPKNRSLTPISIAVIDTIGLVKSRNIQRYYLIQILRQQWLKIDNNDQSYHCARQSSTCRHKHEEKD